MERSEHEIFDDHDDHKKCSVKSILIKFRINLKMKLTPLKLEEHDHRARLKVLCAIWAMPLKNFCQLQHFRHRTTLK